MKKLTGGFVHTTRLVHLELVSGFPTLDLQCTACPPAVRARDPAQSHTKAYARRRSSCRTHQRPSKGRERDRAGGCENCEMALGGRLARILVGGGKSKSLIDPNIEQGYSVIGDKAFFIVGIV